MPIGPPFHVPEPKSAWTCELVPIDETYCADLACTGSCETSECQTLSLGNIGHEGAPGTGVAIAGDAPAVIATMAMTDAMTAASRPLLTPPYRRVPWPP